MAALAGRIALITGASKGIGQAVAKRFAAEGAHVLLVGRNRKGLEQTDDAIRASGGNATLIELDLTESDKLPLLAQQIAQRFGKLDVLVGNAGLLGELTPITDIAPEDWDKVMAVNVTANYQLIRCLDPLLKASDSGRVMFVSSGVTSRIHPYWAAYAVSKAALETLVMTYAEENKNGALKINLIDPGATRTRMRAKAFPGEDPMTLKAPEEITDVFVKLASVECRDHGARLKAQ